MKRLVAMGLTTALLLTLVGGPVFGAGLHGMFEGFPIVRVVVNGREIRGDVPAVLFRDRTLVPIRFVSEALGANVQWDSATETAFIAKELAFPAEQVAQIFMTAMRANGIRVRNVDFVGLEEGLLVTVRMEPNPDMGLSEDGQVARAACVVTAKDVGANEALVLVSDEGQDSPRRSVRISAQAYNSFAKGETSWEEFVSSWVDSRTSEIRAGGVITTPKTFEEPSQPLQAKGVAPPLYLIGADGQFLGKLTTNEFDSDSVFNEFGRYGSKFSSTSIFNEFGKYGSKFSRLSAFNELATDPPYIIDSKGNLLGYLTLNNLKLGAISPNLIRVVLHKLGL